VAARQIEHPVADVLRVLAVSRSSGALEVRGRRSGTFFLHDGDITYAEALGVPPAEEFDSADPRLRSTIQSSIVEVGLNLLADPSVEGERPLFRPGRRHWSGRAIRVGVEALLAEIADQMADFTELGVEPDDEVRLCELPSGRVAALSRRQWALVAQLAGPQTVRSLARRSGTPLRATVETVASLIGAGVAITAPHIREPPDRDPVFPEPASRAAGSRDAGNGEASVRDAGAADARSRDAGTRDAGARDVGIRDPAARSPGSRESPSREPPTRERPDRPSPAGAAEPPEGRLPQRVRGATPLPPSVPNAEPAPEARSRVPPPDDADGGRALALRLLEGLRRL
jgi:hypothetical protein